MYQTTDVENCYIPNYQMNQTSLRDMFEISSIINHVTSCYLSE